MDAAFHQTDNMHKLGDKKRKKTKGRQRFLQKINPPMAIEPPITKIVTEPTLNAANSGRKENVEGLIGHLKSQRRDLKSKED